MADSPHPRRDPNALVRRSTLMMPINVRRFVERAWERDADAVVLDLEDSVARSAKVEARALVAEAARLVARGGADVLVRVNNEPDLLDGDLDAAVQSGVSCVMLPKVESAAFVRSAAARIAEAEEARGLRVGATEIAIQIETARGLVAANEIVAASPRVVSVTLGPEDYCLDLDVQPTREGAELAHANALVLIAARLAVVQPHGLTSTLADFSDLDGFRESARRARALGFKGASCIHPAQVPILNEEFAPSAAEIVLAERVVASLAEAERAGVAAASLDGRMIDTPVATRARRLLARAAAIATKDAAKRAAREAAR